MVKTLTWQQGIGLIILHEREKNSSLLSRSRFVSLIFEISALCLRRRLCRNLRGRWCFIRFVVADYVSVLLDFVQIPSSDLSLRRRFSGNLQRRWCLIRLFLRRCSPPDPCMQAPWRFCFFYIFLPVNWICLNSVKNFVSMMRFDCVYLLSLSLLLHRFASILIFVCSCPVYKPRCKWKSRERKRGMYFSMSLIHYLVDPISLLSLWVL